MEVKQPAKGTEPICKLCLESKPICDSHIIPRHFFRKRDTGSGMFEIISGEPLKKRIPTGWTEKLLCRDCEQHVGRFDDYAAKFFGASASWEVVQVQEINLFMVHEFDFSLLKLFFVSLLWRAAVSSIPAFEAVSFSSTYEEELRKMILNSDPGNEDKYATVIFKFQPYKNEYEKITLSPHKIRHNGSVTYFQVQLNEFPCRIKVSNQKDSARYEGLWLTEKSPLRIMEVPLTPNRFNTMLNIVQTQPKLLKEFRKRHERN